MLQFLSPPKFKTKEDGFTLIELLIVVVIIGILAGIALLIFTQQREAAASAVVQSDLRNAATAMTQEMTKTPGKYPEKLPETLTTSENVVLALPNTGPLTGNPALNQPSTRMSWAETEAYLGINSSPKVKVGSNPGTPMHFFYPRTGNTYGQYKALLAGFCSKQANQGATRTACDVTTPGHQDSVWNSAKASGKIVLVQGVVSSIVAGTYTVDLSVISNPGSLVISQTTNYRLIASDTVAEMNKTAFVPSLIATDPAIYGDPTDVNTSSFCINGSYTGFASVKHHYDSNKGRVAQGHCTA